MSGQDPQLARRLASVEQLSSVVAAMRGIAAARAQHCRAPLAGVRGYADTVAMAIVDVLALMHLHNRAAPQATAPGPRAVVLFFSEQGFVGAFNEHIIAAARAQIAAAAPLFVVGTRGLRQLEATGARVHWRMPMIAQASHVAAAADRIERALLEALAANMIGGADLIHMAGEGARQRVIIRSLLPVDTRRFASTAASPPPMTYQPPAALFASLTGEYLFAQLAEAILENHAAENLARMQAMAAAQDNIARRLEQLRSDEREQRQQVITDELVELASGLL